MTSEPQQDESFDEDQALQELLTRYLAARNVPCAKCGHNLRGTTTGTCPECGETLVLSVGHVDHSSFVWVAAISLYGIAVAFGGIMSLTATLEAVRQGGVDMLSVAAIIVAFVVSIVGFVLLWQRREVFWRYSFIAQCLALLSILLVPLSSSIVIAVGSFML